MLSGAWLSLDPLEFVHLAVGIGRRHLVILERDLELVALGLVADADFNLDGVVADELVLALIATVPTVITKPPSFLYSMIVFIPMSHLPTINSAFLGAA